MKVTTKVTSGDKELTRIFQQLPLSTRNKYMRQSLSAAMAPVLKAAKASASVRTGLLRKALRKEATTAPGGVSSAAVGANRKTVGIHKGKKVRPSRYIHLVEKKSPFLKAALRNNQSQVMTTAKDELALRMEKEMRGLAKS